MGKAGAFIRKALPTVLTIVGSASTIAAVIFAAKEGPRYERIMENKRFDQCAEPSVKEKILTGAKIFAPAIGCAAVSIACGVGAHCLDLKTQANLTGAYVAIQQAYRRYRAKNGEINGEEADISVREAIVKEELPEVMRDANGERLYTVHIEGLEEGRHRDTTSMTKADILTAIIRVNLILDKIGSLTLNDMRGVFDLSLIPEGDELGWSVDMLCAWDQTTQLEFRIDTQKDGSLVVYPVVPSYGGFLTDYGLDF